METLKKEFNFKIHNRFDVEVLDAKTGEIKQRARGYNVICDSAWTRMFNRNGVAQTIIYGSGTGTPSASDTALFNYVGGVTESGSAYGGFTSYDTSNEGNGVVSKTMCRVLKANEAVGVTITEVGLAQGTSASDRINIFTHAMLQDMNGNTISITKTDTDIIKFYSTVYLHFDPTSDAHIGMKAYAEYSGDMENADNRLIPNLLKFNFYYQDSNNISTVRAFREKFDYNGNGSLATLNIGASSSWSANLATKTFKSSKFRYDTNVSINGGVGTIVLLERYYRSSEKANAFMWLETGKTIVPPTVITSESVGTGDGTTTKFKTKTDFPYNATVYVNGQAASNVVVHKYPTLASGNLKYYLQRRYTENPLVPRPDYYINNISAGVYYNRAWEIGIASVSASSAFILYVSDDGLTWDTIGSGSTSYSLTGANQNKKYFKFTAEVSVTFNSYDGNNIEFSTAPAQGDVITIDYTTPYIPKDTDHVIDMEFMFTLGEYVEE